MKNEVKKTAKRAVSAIMSAMLLGSVFSATTFAADVSKTYFDVNFDRSGDTDSSWINAADSGYVFGYASWASADNNPTALVEDSFAGGKVAEFTRPASADGRYYFGTQADIGCTDSFDNCVTWYELSFKFDGAVTGLSVSGAGMPIYISDDGSIQIGYYLGNAVNNYKLEPGHWYHMVVAVDNINKLYTDSSYYAWINATMLTTAETPSTGRTITRNADAMGTKSMSNFLLNIGKNSSADAKVYLDNLKMYTTAGNTDVEDYEPASIYGDAELSSDSLEIAGNTIYVPADASVADVIDAVTASGTGISVYSGGTELAEDEYANVNAVGARICVYSQNGIFPREYNVEAITAKNYYDVNFDRAGDSAAGNVNDTDSGMTFGYASWGSVRGNENKLEKDEITNSNALVIDVPANSGAYVVGNVDSAANCINSFDNRVTWYEFSFKFDGALTGLRLNATGAVCNISEDGKIIFGHPKGAAVDNLTLRLGEWYHMVIAVDNVDKYPNKHYDSDGNVTKIDMQTKFYAWADGKFLTTSGSSATGCTITRSLGNSTTKMDKFYLAISPNTSENATLSLDNIKMYTTVGENDVKNYDPASAYAGAELSSDDWIAEGGVLYIADDELCLADVADLTVSSNDTVFYDGSEAIAEDMLDQTEAIGKIIYVRSLTGGAVRKYIIDTAIYARAWYNDTAMLDCKTAGYMSFLSESGMNIQGATHFKTFCFNSLQKLKPVCDVAETVITK